MVALSLLFVRANKHQCIPAVQLCRRFRNSSHHCPGAAPPQLRHPNVVGFAGVTFHGSKGVVLMELCEGTLRRCAEALRSPSLCSRMCISTENLPTRAAAGGLHVRP